MRISFLKASLKNLLLPSPRSARSTPRHKARAKALPSSCGVTSCFLADKDYVPALFTLEASLKSSCAFVLYIFFSLFGVFMVVSPFILVVGCVVVFLLVDMSQSSPWDGPLYWPVRFFKINSTTGFLSRSLNVVIDDESIIFRWDALGPSPER